MKTHLLIVTALGLTLSGVAYGQSNQVVAPQSQVAPPAATPAAPQLIVNGDQWVIQVPPDAPVPRNIVLQLSVATNQPVPAVLIQQPPGAQAAIGAAPSTEVYVTAPPPPVPTEVIPVAPDRFHVWIGGHYEWRHHGYVWVSGRWARPPHHGARWEPGRWEFRGGHYIYIEGRWD